MPGQKSASLGRREQILQAALECFTSYGFAKATMDDIRARAEASTGSVYHHFKSKEQLAAELYVEGVRSYQEGLQRELLRHRSAERGIKALVRFHLTWIEQNPEWARYLSQSREADFVAATETTLRQLNRKMFRVFGDWIEPFAAAGEVMRLPSDVGVALLIGPAQQYARGMLAGRQRTDLATATRLLGDAAWKSIRIDRGEPR